MSLKHTSPHPCYPWYMQVQPGAGRLEQCNFKQKAGPLQGVNQYLGNFFFAKKNKKENVRKKYFNQLLGVQAPKNWSKFGYYIARSFDIRSNSIGPGRLWLDYDFRLIRLHSLDFHFLDQPVFKIIKNNYIDRMYPNRTNVAEPMSETLKSIKCRRIECVQIERRKIERRSTEICSSCNYFENKSCYGMWINS